MSHAKLLADHFVEAYKIHDHSRSADTSIHVSDLIDFCPREYYICKTRDRGYHPHRYHSMAEKYTHDMGHAIQGIQIKRLLTQHVLFGTWRCRHCKADFLGFQPDGKACPNCTLKSWVYKDTTIEWRMPLKTKPKSQIIVRGNMDYIVATTPTFGFNADAKSMKAEDWDKLEEPLLKDAKQVRLYMDFANRDGATLVGRPFDVNIRTFTIDPEWAVLCYAVKAQRQNPFKTFDVRQDREFIAKIDKKLKELKKALETQTEPTKICQSQNDLMAKACSARDLCFGQTFAR